MWKHFLKIFEIPEIFLFVLIKFREISGPYENNTGGMMGKLEETLEY